MKSRREQAGRQIDNQQDGEHLDGLAGLVVHRAARIHEVGVADGNGQRRVLGQVQILAGERRNDDAQRLRNDDEAQRLAVVEAQRMGRFRLPVADGENAGHARFRQ